MQQEETQRSASRQSSFNVMKQQSFEREMKTKEDAINNDQRAKTQQQQFDKILSENEKLRNQLKSAIDAEEQSTKAMDGLALALKEVATESNQTKEKLALTELQLEQVRAESKQFKELLRTNEEKYSKLLDESKKENEFQKNVIERLRSEAEESLLAWNDKETGLVDCIKNFEDEKGLTQEDNTRLIESLKMAETTARTLREENHKLRDILKQGLKEANVAKESAVIATEENTILKECLAEKDEALDIITREIESLRISEAAAKESVKELKRLLSSSTAPPKEEKFINQTKVELCPTPIEDTTGKKRFKTFSFDISELKRGGSEFEDDNFMECEKVASLPEEDEEEDEDPERAEALKGSIFDTELDSPKSEVRTPVHRRMPSQFKDTVEGDIHNSDHETEPLESDHDNDIIDGRHSPRKRRALLQRFTDLIRIRKNSNNSNNSNNNNNGNSTTTAGSGSSNAHSHKKEVLAE
ncbi:WEB family protein At3g02930, chloroplastic-like [Impatiens glandulifera]|uniref:WEB family protein At3g02930, chloroplastic-like n=1 Tax=Impatiens glandulifera TaxID=253017 RepID=UPI001FB05CFB|nr:WEB family protein At3g02930, chloroplastic-like [Impatiens glandulifera]